MTTDSREFCKSCGVPLVDIGDCYAALDRAAEKLEGAMIDVRRATDARGLKIMLVYPMNLHAVKEKFVSLSRLMTDVIDERAALIDMQSRDTGPKGRVALANHVKLLAALLEAHWEYELVKNGQHQTA